MDDQRALLHEWYNRVAVTQRAHYLSADHFGQKKYWLGVPAVVLTAMVGTSVFASLQKQPELWLQILLGLASVAAAVLTVLQTFMGYSERAEKHRMAGARFGAIGRELEQMLVSTTEHDPKSVSDVRTRLDNLGLESLSNSMSLYRRAEAEILASKPK